MRVLVDCRYVRTGRHDGISRYTAGIVRELARLLPVELLIHDERQLAHLPDLPWHRISAPTSWREPFVALQVRRLRPDVVFSPMQTMGSWGRNYRLVLTLHDLIYYRNPTPPRDLSWPVRVLWRLFHLAWWPQRVLLNRADAVVTVSRTTAELIAARHLTRRQVTVVPNAADPVPDDESGTERGPRTRTLLYMGSFMPYKNVETLARAAALLPDHELHLLSRTPAGVRERLTALAGPGRLVFHDGVSDREYRHLLREATALVSASRDEGFGIPLVEAMLLGTPVVVSDIPVFREVAGDAGAFVPPGDAEGFASAVLALEDPGVWDERSAASREQASLFSWPRSAATLAELLRDPRPAPAAASPERGHGGGRATVRAG
ncbi:glycosyltransferase family 4 protein [Myceligenerans indicum]|uniref:Glycosyltransferase family 4 protein n=1 Tax=Myceligenerans indicum TaxID=2593663 RepID=A0ABS1LF18_9MICO|nr:glycosyltransferase family 1 protein [Myceligenerans indicum]MBL0884860.1 glycosyltransferase family 4 protein [Myceligenerans indicum]